METRLTSHIHEVQGNSSYRTYEEWKRPHSLAEKSTKKSSYRTYEEWKPHE